MLELVCHQEAGPCIRDVGDDADRRGVGAVRRAERVVHVEVRELCKSRRERGVVLLFLGMEPEILQEYHPTRMDSGHSLARWGADAIGREPDRLLEQR